MITVSKNFVGVDVSKEKLDFCIYPIGKSFKIKNTVTDIKKLIEELKIFEIELFGFEATGGYEKLLQKTLEKHNHNCWIVDPRRIKAFIISTGCKAKTDKIDAKKIAEFSAKHCPEYFAIKKSANEQQLQTIINRKNDLVKFLITEKTRLKQPSHEDSNKSIKKVISFLEKEISLFEKQIDKLLNNDKDLSKRVEILQSIPGIGKFTAALLASFVPELGYLSNNEMTSLVGLSPYVKESGNFKGKRFIRGGRLIPRNALYMCSLSAIKYHLPLKAFYERLIEKNKPFKIAIVAVMRKLIIIANVILKKGELCRT